MDLKCLGIVVGLALGSALGASGAPVASVQAEGTRLVAQPLGPSTGVSLSVTGPAGFARSQWSAAGAALLELAEAARPPRDGLYVYEVRLGLAGAEGDPASAGPATQSGVFQVVDGQVRWPAPADERPEARAPAPGPDAQVLVGDVSVQGSLCAGDACTASEPFSAANLLLKEQNNRIRIDDTSTAAGVPSNDWQLTFNDSATNGAGKFALEDLTHATTPFTVMAEAPSHSLFVASDGKVGIGTATPDGDLTIKGELAELVLFARPSNPVRWELIGAASGLFVSKFTSATGFTHPLRIGTTDDNVGLGFSPFSAAGPTASLHVTRTNGSARLLVEEGSSTVTGRNLLQLKNNGPVTLRFDNASNGTFWGFGSVAAGNKFFVSAGGASSLSLALDPAGNLTIAGALTQSSDRNAKDDIAAVDPAQVLARLAELPIATWRYRGDEARHVGPMAQDFHAAFGLGPDDKHVAPADLAGLGLAAVQALRAENQDLRARLEALEAALRDGRLAPALVE